MGITVETLLVGDNYVHLLFEGNRAAVVDPGVTAPVVHALRERDARLELILITHHHGDHTGGCAALRREYGCRIAAPTGGALSVDIVVADGDTVSFAGHAVDVIDVRGHSGHDVAYYLPEAKTVFTGDTLFACGCGRVFGGSPEAMWNSLCRLRKLPEETLVRVGHDYTLDNLRFAAHLDPDNAALHARLHDHERRAHGNAMGAPATIAEELRTNPFLRCDTAGMAAAVGMPGAAPADVFAELRRRKDRW